MASHHFKFINTFCCSVRDFQTFWWFFFCHFALRTFVKSRTDDKNVSILYWFIPKMVDGVEVRVPASTNQPVPTCQPLPHQTHLSPAVFLWTLLFEPDSNMLELMELHWRRQSFIDVCECWLRDQCILHTWQRMKCINSANSWFIWQDSGLSNEHSSSLLMSI